MIDTQEVIRVLYFLAWSVLSPAGFAVCLLNLRDAQADLKWTITEYGPRTKEYEIATNQVRREAVRLGMSFLFVMTLVAVVSYGPISGLFLVAANALVLANSIGDRRARKRLLGGGHDGS